MSGTDKTPVDMKEAHAALNGWWEMAGIDVPPAQRQPKQAKTRRATAKPIQQSIQVSAQAPKAMPLKNAQAAAAKVDTLEELKTALESFDAGPVKAGARNTVFARGSESAPLMVIGEAPGREEDEQGLPFVGQSGKLLDKILRLAGFGDEDIYITNAFNWRPPQNRKPTPDELAMTLPFLERHIALLAPKIIILAGASPMQAVLGLSAGITRARGQWHDYAVKNQDGTKSAKTIPALPTFHPAFLLRAPLAKRDVWHDLQSAKERLEEMAEG